MGMCITVYLIHEDVNIVVIGEASSQKFFAQYSAAHGRSCLDSTSFLPVEYDKNWGRLETVNMLWWVWVVKLSIKNKELRNVNCLFILHGNGQRVSMDWRRFRLWEMAKDTKLEFKPSQSLERKIWLQNSIFGLIWFL